MKTLWIGLLDCNNFFVSCERLFRPDLEGKPVVVLSGDNGCVVARSQEVKDMNVPMGVPYFQVKDTLEKANVTAFSSNFALYRDVSRRVFSVMQEELGLIEQYSIDEAFFKINSDPEDVAEQLKKSIETRVGIPVSIGVAHSKTQAKYASLLAKKERSGVQVLSEKKWQSLESVIPLAHIWGVGGKSELKYKEHGLKTVADLLHTDRAVIRKIFGIAGVRLQQELQGNPVFSTDRRMLPQQSIISSRSFSKTTMELSILADSVAYHIRHAATNLRSMSMKASALRVSIGASRHGDFQLRGGSKEAVLLIPTDDSIELLKVANQLLNELYEEGVPYKKAGITLSRFVSVEQEQASLFEGYAKDKGKTLMSVIDGLNNKNNREVILVGSRLKKEVWSTKSATKSPAYTTQWKELPTVKAK